MERISLYVSSRSISADLPISYPFHVKAIGRQVSPVIPEVSRRCDVTPISYPFHVKSQFSHRPPGVASHPGSL